MFFQTNHSLRNRRDDSGMGKGKFFKEYTILLERNCILLIGSHAAYSLADIAFDFFLSWHVYSVTGDIMNLVAVLGGSVFFKALLSLITGIVSDLANKKYILILSILAGILIIFSSFFVLTYFPDNVWLYLVIILSNDIFNVLFSKAFLTLSTEMFDGARYVTFRSAVSVLNQSIYVLGQAVMGFVLVVLEDVQIIAFIILLLAFTAVLLLFLPYKNPAQSAEQESKQGKADFTESAGASIKNLVGTAKAKVLRDPYYRSFCLVIFTLNLVYGYLASVFPYSLAGIRDESSIYIGTVKALTAVGGILGMLFVPKIARQVTRSFQVGLLGSLISVVFIFHFAESSIGSGIFFFLFGLFDSITQPLYSYTVKRIDSAVRGSMMGVIDFIILMASPIGMFICGALANKNFLLAEGFVIGVFLLAFCFVQRSKELNHIVLE